MEHMKNLLELMEKVPDEVSVDAAFGKPEEYEGRILIPVAEVMYGYGVGFGSAEGQQAACCEEEGSPVSEEEQAEHPPAYGGGGGIGAKARPIAYIEVTSEGTKVKAIVDEQKVALAGIFLSIWAVGWIGLVLKTIFSKRR